LVEQFEASVICVVGIAFDARNLEADLVERCGVTRKVGQHRDRALHEFGAFDDRVRYFAHVGLESRHLEQNDRFRCPLTLVDRIIH
jgi:hypothetical protein